MRSVLWFRHGLRLHDNPSLFAALDLDKWMRDNNGQLNEGQKAPETGVELFPVFIFDGETAGTKVCGYNRFLFLLECLHDLDCQLQKFGGKLHVFKGDPVQVFQELQRTVGFQRLCFEQDCEPVWKTRDLRVKQWCQEAGVEAVERVGHTLYDPHHVIEMNGGAPPVTFNIFNHVIECIGQPPRPLPTLNLSTVPMVKLPASITSQQSYFNNFPTMADFGYENNGDYAKVYIGGETRALEQFSKRMQVEANAFKVGSFLPNRRDPDILCPPKSLSPDLRFGSLSVRKFYWSINDAFTENKKKQTEETDVKAPQIIVIQLMWREFFYTMSVNNDNFAKMENNSICINIPWYEAKGNPRMIAFENGATGYPFIDAGMRQLKKEGWIHHILRNALASFLTRGDLWISWEEGLRIFFEYLLDADWSVCAGNWMWVSSSAFEQVLSCSNCIDPGTYGRRSDPWGDYVRRYVPELAKMPVEYIYEPWKAPPEVQVEAECIVGRDYPVRIVIHEEASLSNAQKMNCIKEELMNQLRHVPKHCGPSSEEETRQFMGFAHSCSDHSRVV